jgi:hypothetical protein
MISMFTVTGQVRKTFIQEGQADKDTGVMGKPSIKVQILGEMPVKGGDSKDEIITLTVENQKTFEDLKGKCVRVPLGFFAPAKGNIVYYIPKGSIPEVVVNA